MRTVRIFVPMILILLLGVVTVHARDAIPKKVREKYPEDKYIIRSGTGETSGQSIEAARFEIAKFFESKISGETFVRQWAQSTTSQGKSNEDHLTEFTNTIIVGASRDIPGIEIAATEYEKKSKTYVSWAVLEKDRYTTVLRERIRETESTVNTRLEKLQGQPFHV